LIPWISSLEQNIHGLLPLGDLLFVYIIGYIMVIELMAAFPLMTFGRCFISYFFS